MRNASMYVCIVLFNVRNASMTCWLWESEGIVARSHVTRFYPSGHRNRRYAINKVVPP